MIGSLKWILVVNVVQIWATFWYLTVKHLFEQIKLVKLQSKEEKCGFFVPSYHSWLLRIHFLLAFICILYIVYILKCSVILSGDTAYTNIEQKSTNQIQTSKNKKKLRKLFDRKSLLNIKCSISYMRDLVNNIYFISF